MREIQYPGRPLVSRNRSAPVASPQRRHVPVVSKRGQGLRSAPGNTNWLPGYFDGEDVFIVGGGPSLIGWNPACLADKNTIAVNHGIRFVPNLDIACFIDVEFVGEMKRHYGIDMQQWPGKVISSQKSLLRAEGSVGIIHVTGNALDFSLSRVYGEYSSAIFAAQVARLAGARRIFLLGMDCKWSPEADHWYPSDDSGYKHRRGRTGAEKTDRERERTYHAMKRHWGRIDGPFIVVGDSALDKWPKMELEDAIRGI